MNGPDIFTVGINVGDLDFGQIQIQGYVRRTWGYIYNTIKWIMNILDNVESLLFCFHISVVNRPLQAVQPWIVNCDFSKLLSGSQSTIWITIQGLRLTPKIWELKWLLS